MTREGSAPRLSMRGIVVAYGESRALDGADLVVEAASAHALLGENGAGKSSMLKALFGHAPLLAGSIEVDGEPLGTGSQAAQRAGLAMAHQELSLVPHLSVADALVLGAHRSRWLCVDRRARDEAAREALRLVGRLDIPIGAPTRSLSPGKRQVVEVARALARSCKLIALDEPTSSLGADDAERLYVALDAARRRGVSVLFVSHALSEVRRVAQRATVLRDGKTAWSGELAGVSDDSLVSRMAGREIAAQDARSASRVGDVALCVEGLRSHPVLDASFELRHGEILGIAGLAGAGRTELLEALCGLRAAQGGSVKFRGIEGARSPAALWRGGIGIVGEDRKHGGLSLAQSIAANVALPGLSNASQSWIVGPRELEQRAARPCERLGVRMRSLAQPARELSGGNQQKVAFARLLACESSTLLLDEPTRGVDVGARAQIHALLRERRDQGAAILVVSSHLPELLSLCDRIAVMRQGRLLPARDAREWTQESLVAMALHEGKVAAEAS